MVTGTVYGVGGGVYRVHLDSGFVVDASLRGRLKQESRKGDRVVIGDRVEVAVDSAEGGTIEEVLSRRSEVVRRGPGGRRPKVVAANVDRMGIVVSAARPEPRQALLDRLLVIGESNGLEPFLVMNKIDLVPGLDRASSDELGDRGEGHPPVHRRLVDLYRQLGYRVLEASAVSGQGIEKLKGILCQGTSALLGPSGVGKSSLLNAIQPSLSLRTGELSHRQGRGRHTTVNARLIPLTCGGIVADTPGFSDAGVWGVAPGELEACFPEFHPAREECSFRGCTHLHEPGCGVQDALERGEIDEQRFSSYRTMVEEAKEGSR
mgnify:CR=1 FL=1